jgi:parallel beta-helix repeat protein
MMKLKRAFIPFLVGLGLALGLLARVSGGFDPNAPASPSAPQPGYRLYHHQFHRHVVEQNATLYLQNRGSGPATVALTFHDLSGGGGTTEVHETIPAGGTLKLRADDVPQLTDQTLYSLIVSSDQEVASVVEVHRSSGDRLAAYRGRRGGQLSTVHHFGPYCKAQPHDVDDLLHSSLAIWNPGPGAATVDVQFLHADGTLAAPSSRVLDAGEQAVWFSGDVAPLPNGFEGWVRVDADRPVTGLLVQLSRLDGDVFGLTGPLGQGGFGAATLLPRTLKGVDEGGGSRTTTLFVGNVGAGEATAQLDYLDDAGTLIDSRTFTVATSGAETFDLVEQGSLPGGDWWAVNLTGDQPLVMGEMTDFDAPAAYGAATYGTQVGDELSLPHVARNGSAHTVFSVHNVGTGDAHVTIDYRDLAGQLVLTQAVTLQTRTSRRYDLRDTPELGEDFEGSATLSSDKSIAAWVDAYDAGPQGAQQCSARIDGETTDHPAVQDAVDAASAGDTVKVAGTCVGVETRAGVTQTVYVDKSITLRGGYTTTNWTTSDPQAHPTTLNAQGQGRVIYVAGSINPVVEGFQITGGDATGLGGAPGGRDAGGGLCVVTATATIRNNRIFGNRSDGFGSGVFLHNSDSLLSGNVVSANEGSGLSGLWSGGVISGNRFIDNVGRGVHLMTSDATFSANTVSSNAGSGLSLTGSDDATVTGNVISHNGESGLTLTGSGAAISNNVIVSNGGGGLLLYTSDATFTNNVVADNRTPTAGSAFHIVSSSPRLLHTTIARNRGGDGSGIVIRNVGAADASPAFINTILVSHTVGISVAAGNTATLNATLWQGNGTDWWGAGSIASSNGHSGDPAFVDPDGGDYHLELGSAAIDAGIAAGVTTDMDGEARPAGAGYDIGADEHTGTPMVSMMLKPPTTTAYVGGTVQLAITIRSGQQPVDRAEAHLDFDPTVLQVVSLTGGSALPAELQNAYDNGVGTVDYDAELLTGDPPSGTFTLATVTFRALTETPGTVISFVVAAPRRSDVLYGGHSVLGEHADGEVRVAARRRVYLPLVVK